MELLYLYIKSYRNIWNQEFRFSTEFDINFDVKSKQLSITNIEHPPLNIFNDSFLNVNAIIGKNGSGKSNLFNFIKTLFIDTSLQQYNFILVAKKSGSTILIIDEVSKQDEKITEKENLEDGTPINFGKIDSTILQSVSLIYYSNSFSIYEKPDIPGSRFVDLSLAYRLNSFSVESNENLINEYIRVKEIYNSKKSKDDYFEFYKNDLIRRNSPTKLLYKSDLLAKINFASKYQNKNWEFLPGNIIIDIDYNFFDNSLEIFSKIGLKDKLIRKIETLLFKSDYESEGNRLKQFTSGIIIYIFLYVIKHNIADFAIEQHVKKLIDELNKSSDKNQIPVLILASMKNWEFNDEDNIYNGLFDFINSIDLQLEIFQKCEVYNNYISSPFTEEFRASLEKVFEFWNDYDFIFSFDWIDLSAGESALLTLFSQLHSSSSIWYKPGDTIWLLIDEGELYLHPEWQRTFFSDLHKYIPLFFADKKVQLFLTSHSPFIVSDLPKENIILLDKNENGDCDVVDKQKLGDTFGANIHTMLSDAFFMEGGLIGEFAKKKIEEVINAIENKKTEKKDEIMKIINLIGDELIKKRLKDMYDEAFGKVESSENDKDYLNWLQDEITRVQLKLKK